jgi:hypothetical protein
VIVTHENIGISARHGQKFWGIYDGFTFADSTPHSSSLSFWQFVVELLNIWSAHRRHFGRPELW